MTSDLGGQLRDDGFLVLPQAIPAADLDAARVLLDGLFSRMSSLPRDRVRLLGDGHAGESIPEINRPAGMLRALRRSPIMARCAELARQLSGHRARYLFDHAIYKSPGTHSETPWHQDVAFDPTRNERSKELHFWIPLQDVSAANGCMRFVRGSHRATMLPHVPVGGRGGHSLEAQVDPSSIGEIVECPIEAGGVTVHYATTLHGSTANHASSVRKAWIIHFDGWGRIGKLLPSNLWRRMSERLF